MDNSLIIRVVYQGVTYDLETLEELPLRLDISAVESQDIGTLFGVGSQKFELPGSKNNNKFFKHAYEVGSEDIPAFYDTIDGYIIFRGETLLKGKFQLLEVTRDENRYVSYACTISDETIQLKSALANKLIKDGDWTPYNHTLSKENVVASWSDNLLSGSVYYPLVDYGRTQDEKTYRQAPIMQITASDGYIGSSLSPLNLKQVLPAVKVKDTLDVIFDQVGFRYTGDFVESEDFNNLYILNKPKEGLGVVVEAVATADFDSTANANQTIPINQDCFVSSSVEILDPSNAYDPTTGVYTIPEEGEYTFQGQIGFFNPVSPSSSAITNINVFFAFDTGGSIVPIVPTLQSLLMDQSKGIGPHYINVSMTQPFAPGVKIRLMANMEQFTGAPALTVTFLQNSTQFKAINTPVTYEGAEVEMDKQWQSDTKSIDVLKGLITQFNLVMEPDPIENRLIRIDTFDTWMRSGTTKDWTEKWNTATRTSINHTVDELQQEVFFKNTDDNDRFSKLVIDSDPNLQYGTIRLLADNNVSQGTKKIESIFSPIILGGSVDFIPDGGEQDFGGTYDIDLNTRFVIPHMYKWSNKTQESYTSKPRLGYKVTAPLSSGSNFFVGTSSDSIEISGSYTTISNLSSLPAVSGITNDLHFNNTYPPFTGAALNMNSGVSNFEKYWKTYIDSLYWEGSRKVTLDVKFNPEEYKDIRLNDKIFIKDQQYRINKIKGFNLNNDDIATVELIRLYPAYYSFDAVCDFDYTVDNLNCDFTFEALPWVGPTPTPFPSGITPTPTPEPSGITPTPTPTGVTPTPTPSGSTPTPTPTGVTPTPTPIPVFDYTGTYAYGSYQSACSSSDVTTIYTQNEITTGSIAYSDSNLTTPFDFARFFVDGTTGIGYEFVDPNTTGQVIDILNDACNVEIYKLFTSFNQFDACTEASSKTVYAEPGDLIENGTILYTDIDLRFTWLGNPEIKFIVSGSDPKQIYYNTTNGVSQSGTDICYEINSFNGWDSTADTPPAAVCGDYDEVFYVKDTPQIGDNIFTDVNLTDPISTAENFVYNDDLNQLYVMSGSTSTNNGFDWVIGDITSSYCSPATPTPSPTPAPIVTPFTASYAYSSWLDACTNPTGTTTLYHAEIWNPIEPAGYEEFIYEDAALTDEFTFYVYVVNQDTGVGYEMFDPNSFGKIRETYNDICNPNQVTINYSFNEFEACAGTLTTTKYIDPGKEWGDAGVVLYNDFDRTSVFSTIPNEYVSTSSLDRSIYQYSGGVLVDSGVDCWTPSSFSGSDYTAEAQPSPICGVYEKTLYVKDTPQIGSVIFTDAAFTDPIFTGNNWVYNDTANELYQMSGSAGTGNGFDWVIGTIITDACSPPTPTPSPTPAPLITVLGGSTGSTDDNDGFTPICNDDPFASLVKSDAWLVGDWELGSYTYTIYKDASFTTPWTGTPWIVDGNNNGYYMGRENQNGKVNFFYYDVCKSGSLIDVYVEFQSGFDAFCSSSSGAYYQKEVFISESRSEIQDYDYIFEDSSCTEIYNDQYRTIRDLSNGNVWVVANEFYQPDTGSREPGQVFAHDPQCNVPLPTPTPTPVPVTPTPTPTPTPTSAERWIRVYTELCSQPSTWSLYNWYGDPAIFPGKFVYDGDYGYCWEVFYDGEGFDAGLETIDCSSRFKYYDTCSDCQTFSNEVPC